MEYINDQSQLAKLLSWCDAQGATDLHARAGHPYIIRVHGQLRQVHEDYFPAPSQGTLLGVLREAFSPATYEQIERATEFDLSFYRGDNRFRANFSKQRGLQSFSFRSVPQQRLKLNDLQLPPTLSDLTRSKRGLILATGPTGQGKSTTMRALIQEMNETESRRVVTVEDPIEYVFTDQLSHFEQREVGIDTASFADGIRNAMRQDPDVLFVGEIRDRESIFAAMQAAETGHLVLTTLHADSVAQAIARILEFYPTTEQNNISSLLARNLNAIICQRLLPNLQGTQTPCLELLRRDAGVQQAILANDLELLTGIVESSVNQGMHTSDQYLVELLAAGIISETVARQFAANRHKLDLTLSGFNQATGILRKDPVH